ncbi:MAG TPA: glycosyltransferase [Phycisphaerales bacterium]|nr:glycosyltransferase [Phycisphaerales bacterium]
MIDHARTAQARPRIALAHDWLCTYRGGEAVLERIARIAGETGEIDRLYTMFDEGRSLAPATDAVQREVSSLRRLPPAARRWVLPLYPAAVGELSRRLARRQAVAPIDLLVSTSSAAIKGMRAPRGVPHLCYCHAPARYIWSVRDEYSQGRGPGAVLRRGGLWAAAPWFKRWDRASSANVTRFLAPSSHTARQIERFYGRVARVVHPPVRTDFFTPGQGGREDFWLFVGALEPYKRADLAIEGAAIAGARLKIAGAGSMAESLRRLGAGHVEFLGRVSDEELRDLYRRARLLVFPQVEDFGITAVEAQACGCPVVARRAGGALDTVLEGQTGAFFGEATAEGLVEAARNCPGDAPACRANSMRFGTGAFDAAMREEIAGALAGATGAAQGSRAQARA